MPRKYSDPRVWRRFLIAAALAAAALASASLLASCVRKGPQASKPKVAAQTSSALSPAANPAQTAPKPATPVAPLAASVRDFGLGAPSAPRPPWDYSLGPLQSSRPAEGDETAVYAIATAFLKGIGEGKLDKELLLPQSRDALSVILAPPDRGSTSESAGGSAAVPAVPYRLGAIIVSGFDASLRLRLPAAVGEPRVEGLLSLRKVDDAWYVEALALDPPEEGTLAFNPDASAGAGAQRR